MAKKAKNSGEAGGGKVEHGSAPADGPLSSITITLPVCAPDPDSYIATMGGRINTRLDRAEQLEAFKRVHAGLRASNAPLANGRPVDGAPDVLRWLFEQVQAQLGLV